MSTLPKLRSSSKAFHPLTPGKYTFASFYSLRTRRFSIHSLDTFWHLYFCVTFYMCTLIELEPEEGLTMETTELAATGVVSTVLTRLRKQVYLLDITAMSELRKDAHPSKYSGGGGLDCSHWCIPGLPDTWNQLLNALLVWKLSSICLLLRASLSNWSDKNKLCTFSSILMSTHSHKFFVYWFKIFNKIYWSQHNCGQLYSQTFIPSLNSLQQQKEEAFLKLSLLQISPNLQRTCKRISAGVDFGTFGISLSVLEMLSSSPRRNRLQTGIPEAIQHFTILRNKKPSQNWGIRENYYLMNPKSELYALDYKLFFFRTTGNHSELCRCSLHVLHCQFHRCQLYLKRKIIKWISFCHHFKLMKSNGTASRQNLAQVNVIQLY